MKMKELLQLRTVIKNSLRTNKMRMRRNHSPLKKMMGTTRNLLNWSKLTLSKRGPSMRRNNVVNRSGLNKLNLKTNRNRIKSPSFPGTRIVNFQSLTRKLSRSAENNWKKIIR